MRNNDVWRGPLRVVAFVDVFQCDSRYRCDVDVSTNGFELRSGKFVPAELPILPEADPRDPGFDVFDFQWRMRQCRFDLFERKRNFYDLEHQDFACFFDAPLVGWDARCPGLSDRPDLQYVQFMSRDVITAEWDCAYALKPVSRDEIQNGLVYVAREDACTAFPGVGLGCGIARLLNKNRLLFPYAEGVDLTGTPFSAPVDLGIYKVIGAIGKKAQVINEEGFTVEPDLVGIERLLKT